MVPDWMLPILNKWICLRRWVEGLGGPCKALRVQWGACNLQPSAHSLDTGASRRGLGGPKRPIQKERFRGRFGAGCGTGSFVARRRALGCRAVGV